VISTETRLTVRYAETDQMGIAHHSNYAVWFEAGRTDFWQQTGMSYSSLEERGVLLPLYEMNCQFKSPAKYEDEIIVVTSLDSISRVCLCFSYQVLNAADHTLLATGETRHTWTDKALNPINVQKTVPDVYAVLSNPSTK